MAATKAKKPETVLKWHGGKTYLAPQIVSLMPKHTHYVETHFGGGAVLLTKDPTGVSEVVNDINSELANFWYVLSQPLQFDKFKRVMEATPFSEHHYDWAVKHQEQLADLFRPDRIPDGVERLQRACDFFIRCRQSMSGKMKSFAPLTRNRVRKQMNEQVSAWWSCVAGLDKVHARLGRVVILNRDALDVIRGQDGPATLFYSDPPYLHETRVTKADYEREMTEAQHVELLETLAGIKGKFMLSGYASPLYTAHAEQNGWNVHRFNLPNNSSSAKKKDRKIECVWCNF